MSHPSIADNADSDFLPASRPSLPDLESCEQWLTTASMGDSRQACAAFILQIGELAALPPRHAVYLQILERLRPLVEHMHGDHGFEIYRSGPSPTRPQPPPPPPSAPLPPAFQPDRAGRPVFQIIKGGKS